MEEKLIEYQICKFFYDWINNCIVLCALFYVTILTEDTTGINFEMFFPSCVICLLLSNRPTFLCSFYVYRPPRQTWRNTQSQKNPHFVPPMFSSSASLAILKQAASPAGRLWMIDSSAYSVVYLRDSLEHHNHFSGGGERRGI